MSPLDRRSWSAGCLSRLFGRLANRDQVALIDCDGIHHTAIFQHARLNDDAGAAITPRDMSDGNAFGVGEPIAHVSTQSDGLRRPGAWNNFLITRPDVFNRELIERLTPNRPPFVNGARLQRPSIGVVEPSRVRDHRAFVPSNPVT